MRNDVAYHRSVRETLADLEVGFEQPTVSSQDDVKCDEIDEDVSCNNIDDILEDSKSLTDVSTKYESPEPLGLEDSDKSAEVDIAKMDLDVAETVSENGKECSDDK
ncbi:hypothetical protein BKA69DRAFT_1104990 [Paraphysoderma sedebokerense]|nr:hypothetical protein BKA69DRAFT_1104990 [Paraphysoderma sedebokerense]